MRADGEITRDVFAAKSDAVRRQIREQRDLLVELRNAMEVAVGGSSDQIVKAIQAVVEGTHKLTCPQRRAALASIVRRIDVAVTPTGERQPRRPTGQFFGRGAPRWRPAAFTFHLAGAGDRVGQSGTTSSSPNEKRQGLAGEVAALVDVIKRQPWTALEGLKGNQDVIRNIEEAEQVLKALRNQLSHK